MGGPSGILIPPYRAMDKTVRDDWNLVPADEEEYAFCHNDLSQHNVLVDPISLKITAIIDWEYAGFFPAWFEMRFLHEVEEVDDGVLIH
jgi:thiamine kinase-like enzyme